MKLYISGPISGLTQDEYTTNFGRAEALLLDEGHEPVNPLKVGACEEENCNRDAKKDDGSYLHSWSCYLKWDLIDMLKCDGVVMIPGWRQSVGADLEKFVATRVGMPIFEMRADYTGFSEMGV
jgi:hypothetical protein